MEQWRLLYDSPTTGAHNMARDEAILRAVAAQHAPPTLRLYAWNPPCLSLGFGQKAADVDGARLAAYGWGVVRRPTGGRAILHTDELTYSIAMPLAHPLAQGQILDAYLRLSAALVLALTRMGVPAERHDQPAPRDASGPVCFDVPSRYEITVGGRKLVGSAQVRRGGGVLQHGSLPLCGDVTRIVDVLAYDDDDARAQARTTVAARALTLEQAGAPSISWAGAADALAGAFAEALGLALVPGTLSADEEADAATLAHTVYADADHTFRR